MPKREVNRKNPRSALAQNGPFLVLVQKAGGQNTVDARTERAGARRVGSEHSPIAEIGAHQGVEIFLKLLGETGVRAADRFRVFPNRCQPRLAPERALCYKVTEVDVTQRLKRIRGAIGIGLTWAVAWSGAGAIVVLGFLLETGSRPDPPFPLMFGVFGFVAGVTFSGVLVLVEGRRRFDQMSLPRFAAWGAAVGLLLAAIFVLAVASGGDTAFIWNLLTLGPIAAAAAAGCAAGSLALARRARLWRSLLVQLCVPV